MAMNVSQGAGHREIADVNTTPLIDVMLVLLVMMIMTLPVQNHSVSMDQSRSPIFTSPLPSIYIDIDPDGTIVWNNEPLTGMSALEARFRDESLKEPQPQEYERFRPGHVLFTYLHLAADERLTRFLADRGPIGIKRDDSWRLEIRD